MRSGGLELFANGQYTRAFAGDVAYLPRGEAHRFRGLDCGEPNRFDVVVAPGGFEHFFERWTNMFVDGAPSVEQMLQLTGEYGISVFPEEDAAPVAINPRSKVVRAADRPAVHLMGEQVTVLLDAEDTSGRYALLRMTGVRDAGPPLHVHTNEDELFMVEDGQIDIHLDHEIVSAFAGDMVWAPRGHAHTFRVASDLARMTVLITPGGFEDFFSAVADLHSAGDLNVQSMSNLSQNYGVSLVS